MGRAGVPQVTRTPEQEQRRRVSRRERYANDPDYRAAAQQKANDDYAAATPEILARKRANGRRHDAKVRADPVRSARLRAARRAKWDAIVADPAKHEAELKRRRDARAGAPKEIAVEQYLCDAVTARRGFCPKFVDPGRRGAPDRVVMLPGYPSYFVELKRPKFGGLAPWQLTYHREIQRAGQEIHVLWSKTDVDGFMAAHPPKCDLL
jgi:hypothetical protein